MNSGRFRAIRCYPFPFCFFLLTEIVLDRPLLGDLSANSCLLASFTSDDMVYCHVAPHRGRITITVLAMSKQTNKQTNKLLRCAVYFAPGVLLQDFAQGATDYRFIDTTMTIHAVAPLVAADQGPNMEIAVCLITAGACGFLH